MESQTPQFNETLETLLNALVPHTRICGGCGNNFEVNNEDLDSYKLFHVPPPKNCPTCRRRRRFGHLMRVPKFFKRKCNVPSHIEEIISVFPPDSPHLVYDFSYYHSDIWGGEQFKKEFNLSRSFFEQFKEFYFSVPHLPLERDPRGVDSDFCLGGRNSKNNYYSSMGYESEDILYCIDARYSRNITDCGITHKSEQCYWCVGVDACAKCIHVIDSENCLESAFLFDCKNCSNCFLSSGLRNKNYVFNNEELSKEEYEIRIQDVNLGNRETFNLYKKKFDEMTQHTLRRSVHNVSAIQSVGDNISDSKNCYFCFRVVKCENLRYCENHELVKDAEDVTNCVTSENMYDSAIVLGSNIRFSLCLRNCTFMEYCIECYNSDYCFGCVGLKNKKFHIFNKPYSEDEYWEKLDEIKTKMLQNEEYGEFFDLSLGLMTYQSSMGQYYFPLTEQEAQQKRIPWYSEPNINISSDMKVRDPHVDVQKDILEISDDIVGDAILCEKSKKPFRIVPKELEFYRKMNIPVPILHPWERMMERRKFEHPFQLFEFVCRQCGEKSFSIFTKEEQAVFKIFCEKCYLKEVI